MYRLFIIFIFSPLFLASCSLPGTQDESEVVEENTVIYEGDDITLRVPKTWTGKTTGLPSPRIGSIVASFVSTEAKQWYANNLLIIADTLVNIMTSKRYSELNSLQTKNNYLEYSSLKEEDITFSDSEISRVFVFEARYNETTPKMKFIQTARVCGQKVYLLHFSLSPDKKSENYIPLLESFTCK